MTMCQVASQWGSGSVVVGAPIVPKPLQSTAFATTNANQDVPQNGLTTTDLLGTTL